MKRLIIIPICLLLFLAGCKKALEDSFINPDTIKPEPSTLICGLFTGIQYQWKFYVQDYAEYWYSLSGGTAIPGYSQIAQRFVTPRYNWFQTYDDLVQGNGFGDGILVNRFNDTYAKLFALTDMKRKLSALDGQAKADNTIYISLGSVIKCYAIANSVDLFNSIPYSEAMLGMENFMPKYDDPKEIYKSLITELGEIEGRLAAEGDAMSEQGKTTFAFQDIFFKGSIDNWREYTNALRLKLAVRISGVEPDFAREAIAQVLAGKLPSRDFTWSLKFTQTPPGGETWTRGMYENTYAIFIPDIIMKRMNYGTHAYEPGTDDPRLPVLALPTKFNDNKDYMGVTYDVDRQTPDYTHEIENAPSKTAYYPYGDNLKRSLKENSRSIYNLGTFGWNEYFPVYMSSLAETSLLLAEIELKGLGNTGKTSTNHITDALKSSTAFWYTINGLSRFEVNEKAVHPDAPASGLVDTYAKALADRYDAAIGLEEKMEIIMQQKYIHLNMMCYTELFTELRRTRHPKLEPMIFQAKKMTPMPERIRYPSRELTTNEENFKKVSREDNFTSPIFWVPEAKRTESCYLPEPLH